MINDKEKSIYNSFLYASRKAKNKPVRLRQNFDSIQSKDEVALKKLNLLLSKYSHINYSDFFIAPYKIYGPDDYFDLSFFNTRRAIKCYSMYCKDKQVQNPDSEDSLNILKDCLKFIFNFCNEEKITLTQYKNYTGVDASEAIPIIFTHLKNHKINFYLLHALDVGSVIKKQDETLSWIISDFHDLYSKTRAKFVSSKLLKSKAKKGIEIIEQKLLKYRA
jgi:hypothetical protein|tara:strand:+ start:6070 stop:6729 length:660 start_codon:yes stop_codon:yes gene_type:complete